EKLAAAEWHFETSEDAPLLMFGKLEDDEVKYALKIPYALSILAGNSPNTEVIGLDQVPEDETPPIYIHYLFDMMVTIGMWMIFLSLMYWLGTIRRWRIVDKRWFCWVLVLGGPLSLIAFEAGWWMAEVGRQVWVLTGLLKTSHSATPSGKVELMLMVFAGLYI